METAKQEYGVIKVDGRAKIVPLDADGEPIRVAKGKTTNRTPSAYPSIQEMKDNEMITKKTKKTNTKPATIKQVAQPVKKATPKRSKGKGALNLFFSFSGFVGVIWLLLLVFVPVHADTITKEGNGTFIEEDFTCKVALADYAELQRVLKITPKSDWKYGIFLKEYQAVTKELKAHSECEGVQDE